MRIEYGVRNENRKREQPLKRPNVALNGELAIMTFCFIMVLEAHAVIVVPLYVTSHVTM